MVVPPYPVLASDEVRHVGDAVAFIVAETLDQALYRPRRSTSKWDALPHASARRGRQLEAPERRRSGRPGPATCLRGGLRRSAKNSRLAIAKPARSFASPSTSVGSPNYSITTAPAIGEYDAGD
jgi:hypothetical protein